MKKISTGDARERFAEIINDAADAKRTVIMRHGKEVAAVVPISDLRIPPGSIVVRQTPEVYIFTTVQHDASFAEERNRK